MSLPKKAKPIIIATSTDPQGRIVHLTDSTWGHIALGHPDVKKSGISRIKSTIIKPSIILYNETRESIIYINVTSSISYFNVVTSPDKSQKISYVVTAYNSIKLKQGDTIWLQSK